MLSFGGGGGIAVIWKSDKVTDYGNCRSSFSCLIPIASLAPPPVFVISGELLSTTKCHSRLHSSSKSKFRHWDVGDTSYKYTVFVTFSYDLVSIPPSLHTSRCRVVPALVDPLVCEAVLFKYRYTLSTLLFRSWPDSFNHTSSI